MQAVTHRSVSADQAFLNDFSSMSTIGATSGGGVDRQAATLTDGRTRHWFRGLAEAHGFTVAYDEVGNQFATLELVPDAPYIAIGSHLDSQPRAGRFDGAYGVLSGIHAAIRIKELLRSGAHDLEPGFNLMVINWFNEEGCRFKPSMMGSAVFTGKTPVDDALETTDREGVTVREALDRIDTRGSFRVDVQNYVEIHIEQGRTLEDRGLTIGLVESTWGAHKYEFTVHGEQAHTGSTVIADRHDALLGASELVVAARDIADRYTTNDQTVITSCGQLTAFPNSPVVVASHVELLVDMRSTDENVLSEADAEFHRRISEIESHAAVTIERTAQHVWPVQRYHERGLQVAEDAADALELRSGTAQTRAGHDSTNMKDVVPTVMLFVPSVAGISHNEKEFTADEDMLDGVAVLTETVARILDGALDRI